MGEVPSREVENQEDIVAPRRVQARRPGDGCAGLDIGAGPSGRNRGSDPQDAAAFDGGEQHPATMVRFANGSSHMDELERLVTRLERKVDGFAETLDTLSAAVDRPLDGVTVGAPPSLESPEHP
jgi:hypothetical protein